MGPKGWGVEDEESDVNYIKSFIVRKNGILFSGAVPETVIKGMSAQEIYLNGHKQAAQESPSFGTIRESIRF